MHRSLSHPHRWGVILAGGEGVRLRPLTRLLSGDERPKQYCPLLGGRTLLRHTIQRVSRNISSDRMLYVVLAAHEPFYRSELGDVPASRLLAQPSNRGTLPAILGSLMLIGKRDEHAVVGIFPSDHHYEEEERLKAGIDLAFDAAEEAPSVVLLGAAAKHPAADFGWIEAEPAVSTRSNGGILRVRRFWEKPSPQIAKDLFERGCIWNTLVMVGRVRAFLDIICSAAPELYETFDELGADIDEETLRSIYEELPPADFSKLVLSGSAADTLGVFSLGDVGWTDLGDPRRVIKVLAGNDPRKQMNWATLMNLRAMSHAS
jgi:mannose-1-phosphate guanylyltransferase